jgi:hypothetical protein
MKNRAPTTLPLDKGLVDHGTLISLIKYDVIYSKQLFDIRFLRWYGEQSCTANDVDACKSCMGQFI